MNTISDQQFWEARDKEGYINNRMKMNRLTAAGKTPTRPVASRWYNSMSTIAESNGDIWVHSDTKYLWWTESLPDEPVFEEILEPVGRKQQLIICHKPCKPWSKTNRKGNPLSWAGLHAKSKDFLKTPNTLQQLKQNNSDYAHALINGDDLSFWHNKPEWMKKVAQSKTKAGPVKIFNDKRKAAFRMAKTAMDTVKQSDGRTVEQTTKIKNMNFKSEEELRLYIEKLIDDQDNHCALTKLPLNMDESGGDPEMRCSLDRIDSDGHYEEGNLQIVCKFANRWKGASDDADFRRLVAVLREIAPYQPQVL